MKRGILVLTKKEDGMVKYCGAHNDAYGAWKEVLEKLYDFEMKTVDANMLAFGEGFDAGYSKAQAESYQRGFDDGY